MQIQIHLDDVIRFALYENKQEMENKEYITIIDCLCLYNLDNVKINDKKYDLTDNVSFLQQEVKEYMEYDTIRDISKLSEINKYEDCYIVIGYSKEPTINFDIDDKEFDINKLLIEVIKYKDCYAIQSVLYENEYQFDILDDKGVIDNKIYQIQDNEFIYIQDL